MSHTILYRRLFLKLSSGAYIALVEAGDNNVYERNWRTGREMRAKDWESWSFAERKFSYTAEDVRSWLEGCKYKAEAEAASARGKDVVPETHDANRNFGWYASVSIYGHATDATSWGMFRSFFDKGLRDAMPVDDYLKHVGPLRVTWYEGDEYKHGPVVQTEHELEACWTLAAGKAHGGGPWIRPINTTCTANVAEMVGIAPGKNPVAVRAFLNNECPARLYIKTLFPLVLTMDKAQALRMSGKYTKKLWGALSLLRQDLRSLIFEPIK